MKKTYTGGCHCGAVRYEADIDLSKGTVRCNCSMCSKSRAWLVGIGSDDFRLLKGQEMLSDYQFNRKSIHHLFCRNCGVKSFGRSNVGPDGKGMVAIMLGCIDNITDAELAALPIMYVDGRNDDMKKAPAETRHL
ncbi:MAG TPA: GFA family protein [Steroidobacteraceae bacterium]|jgi:hypothetical protein|nr:GFA family protein [Steroidobacteraceae bacterium]